MATKEVVLFGREDELRALDDAFAACRRGTGRIVVVTGPAGIGKSSLCDAIRARFGAVGAPVLAGLAGLGPVPAGITRAWPADRVLAQLTAWSAAQPVVLTVEDVQWIDPSSRALLDALVRVAARLPLLVVLTARDQPDTARWLAELSVMAHVRHGGG